MIEEEQIVSKEELRWCTKFTSCKSCPKMKECRFIKDKNNLLKKYFIHIDLGGYYGKRSNQTSTNKD